MASDELTASMRPTYLSPTLVSSPPAQSRRPNILVFHHICRFYRGRPFSRGILEISKVVGCRLGSFVVVRRAQVCATQLRVGASGAGDDDEAEAKEGAMGCDEGATRLRCNATQTRRAQAVPLKLRRRNYSWSECGLGRWRGTARVSPAKRLLPVPGSRVRPSGQMMGRWTHR
jgi:hypothetical protein